MATLYEFSVKNIEDVLRKQTMNAILTDLPKMQCMVGVAGDAENKENGENIASYASKNEFGSFSGGVPARPFLSSTLERKDYLDNFQAMAAKTLNEMAVNNKGTKDFLNKIGLYAAGLVKKNITTGNWKPNTAYTIAKKGSSKPLIDTGDMRRAITSWVKKV